MAVGRSTDPRTLAGVSTTATSTALTAPAGTFAEEDTGRTITGPGIPAGSTLAAVTSDTAATLSAAATATGTITAAVGQASAADYGFVGWSPETDTESESYTVAAVTSGVVPPGRITDTTTAAAQRARG
jgi:hypothetical protein